MPNELAVEIVADHAQLVEEMEEIRDALVEHVDPPNPSPYQKVNCKREALLSLEDIVDKLDIMINRAKELRQLRDDSATTSER